MATDIHQKDINKTAIGWLRNLDFVNFVGEVGGVDVGRPRGKILPLQRPVDPIDPTDKVKSSPLPFGRLRASISSISSVKSVEPICGREKGKSSLNPGRPRSSWHGGCYKGHADGSAVV